ncbi:MAG TPA: alkyl sulfatase dimerization domain-containing protein [Alphaproteobacteria bacterium]|nr:alkyl sulfatase dimerization domain-containing protein [Alphaproteobacteria bacterium]
MRWLGALACIAAALAACDGENEAQHSETAGGASALEAHSLLFERQVISPARGIHVAVGYGLANSIMIEGDDGVIIVDTLESRSRARAVLAAFREITKKPVAAIILTHNHADHIYGGQVFAEGREVPVYAHRSTNAHIDRIVNVLADAIYRRGMRMFGQLLPAGGVVNAGIGPDLGFETPDMALERPNRVFDDELEVEVAGVRLKLVHAPGETDDQIFVWLPERKILLPADNIYQTFPNLYTIRGTAHRDVMQWVESLDRMRSLEPEILVPSHTRPVVGRKRVAEILTAYRDAIQFVHDQTVRGINRGLTPDEIVAAVRLPRHLAEHPWLIEHYGTVAWSVRAVYGGYLGWFGGDAVTLEPLPPVERSKRLMAAFAAGRSLPDQARAALAAGEPQWAAELARHWLRAEPEAAAASALLSQALEAKARDHINPNARHWYLTQAREVRGELEIERPDPSALPDDMLLSLPIDGFLAGMTTRLNAEEALETDTRVQFDFSDLGRRFTMHVRRGVAELSEGGAGQADIRIATTSATWKRIVTKKRNPALAYAADEIDLDGGLVAVVKFLALFDR